ncbi:hypothetical protein EUZ85_20205 [Hahella sp. KA22]|uniref:hypothetical protein n=1 Tax=Hahella sp. KA22 TaxID=1628392 RepID=UPI000FDCF5DE|nr:hypothetical protein [Hahella sp. KA22]AZZ92924.1 hypothetical protein ENC22_17625 [Hahella sp. KA22]QAY56298.1 hypothetical protein EUZ85_20205 [Hahella sp. KA22]
MKELEQLLTASAIQDANWASDLLAHMSIHKDDYASTSANIACSEILAHPDAIAHPRWPELVEAAINASRDFEDVAEEIYGERISIADDEGWLCQGFDSYSTTYSVAELLGVKAARAHPQWFSLVLKLIEMSDCNEHQAPVGEDTILPAVLDNHPQWDQLIPHLLDLDHYTFMDTLLPQRQILSHPDLMKWVTPFKSHVMMVRAITHPDVAAHERWRELALLVKDQPYIRNSSDFPALQKLLQERGLE